MNALSWIRPVLKAAFVCCAISSIIFSVVLGWSQSDLTLFKFLFSSVAIGLQLLMFVMLAVTYILYINKEWTLMVLCGILTVGLIWFDFSGTTGALKSQSAEKELKLLTESTEYKSVESTITNLDAQIANANANLANLNKKYAETSANQQGNRRQIESAIALATANLADLNSQKTAASSQLIDMPPPKAAGYNAFYSSMGSILNIKDYQMWFYNFIAGMLTAVCVLVPLILAAFDRFEGKNLSFNFAAGNGSEFRNAEVNERQTNRQRFNAPQNNRLSESFNESLEDDNLSQVPENMGVKKNRLRF